MGAAKNISHRAPAAVRYDGVGKPFVVVLFLILRKRMYRSSFKTMQLLDLEFVAAGGSPVAHLSVASQASRLWLPVFETASRKQILPFTFDFTRKFCGAHLQPAAQQRLP